MRKGIKTSIITTMLVVMTVSLISVTTTAYAQQEENKTGMDKSHKYFAIQDTKNSVPDNLAPEHQQFHQIAVALPPQPNKI
jgi:hypothetical protein